MTLIFHHDEWLVLTILFGIGLSAAPRKDYCTAKCKEGHHTMCEKFYKPGGTNCTGYRVFLSPDEVTFILDEINKWRQYVANGKMKNLPKGSNIVMIHWDKEAWEISTRWAEQCDQVTNDECRLQVFTSRDDGGQCISTKGGQKESGQNWARKTVIKEMIDYWFSLGKNLNGESIDIYKPTTDTVKDFTQVVWAHTDRVGCGFSVAGDEREAKFKLVCDFYAAGNIENLAVYLKGEPCTACPAHYPHCSDEYPGLCTVKPPAPSHANLLEFSSSLFTVNLILVLTYMLEGFEEGWLEFVCLVQ